MSFMKNNTKQIQVTKDGYESLKAELDELVNVKRPKLVERLERARNEGDLSENSDYISAKEELEFLDGRIDELKHVVDHATVLSTNSNGSNKVDVGTKVTVKTDSGEQIFDIVGEWEADPMNKKISHESPLGSALVGKKVGESVEVEAPAGKLFYEILKID